MITGGNGLIGSHLAEKLIDRGDSVTLLDLVFDSNTKGFSCEKVKADIRNYGATAKAIEGKDAVFHFAAVSRVVWGQQDRILPVAHAQVAVAKIPGARLEIYDRCGHMPQLEYPDKFNRLVLDFLAA